MGNELMQQLQALSLQRSAELADAGDVAAGSIEAGHQAELDRVDAAGKDDGKRGGCRPRGERGRRGALATITATGRRTSSAASAGSRSYRPSAQRDSIAT